MVKEISKLVTDRETFNARMLQLLKEGNYTFMNTLINEVVYIRESFPDDGEVLVDHGLGNGKQYRLNIAFLDVYRPEARGVHQVFEDLLRGWVKPVTILLLMMVPMFINAQNYQQFREKPATAIYLAYQPWDHGLGIRADHHFNHWAGMYGSASYGQWGLYQQSGLGQHMKLTAGILIPYKDYAGGQFDWSVGLNYHKVWGEIVESEIFKDDPQFHNPWSFELGLTCKLERFAIGVRTDILRWEPCVDIGIPLNFKNRYHKHRVKMPKK